MDQGSERALWNARRTAQLDLALLWLHQTHGISQPSTFGRSRFYYGDLDSDFPPTRPSSPDYSKALILHPIQSNFACTHPKYNPFTSLNTIPGYLTYSDNDLLVNDLLNHLSIGMESASME